MDFKTYFCNANDKNSNNIINNYFFQTITLNCVCNNSTDSTIIRLHSSTSTFCMLPEVLYQSGLSNIQ